MAYVGDIEDYEDHRDSWPIPAARLLWNPTESNINRPCVDEQGTRRKVHMFFCIRIAINHGL